MWGLLAVFIAKVLAPLTLLVVVVTFALCRRNGVGYRGSILTATIVGALITDIFLTSMQATRYLGQGLLVGVPAAFAQALVVYGAVRLKRHMDSVKTPDE